MNSLGNLQLFNHVSIKMGIRSWFSIPLTYTFFIIFLTHFKLMPFSFVCEAVILGEVGDLFYPAVIFHINLHLLHFFNKFLIHNFLLIFSSSLFFFFFLGIFSSNFIAPIILQLNNSNYFLCTFFCGCLGEELYLYTLIKKSLRAASFTIANIRIWLSNSPIIAFLKPEQNLNFYLIFNPIYFPQLWKVPTVSSGVWQQTSRIDKRFSLGVAKKNFRSHFPTRKFCERKARVIRIWKWSKEMLSGGCNTELSWPEFVLLFFIANWI